VPNEGTRERIEELGREIVRIISEFESLSACVLSDPLFRRAEGRPLHKRQLLIGSIEL
jgi:hypothetical protein